MIRTRVGYTGGTTRDPTYHDLADHTETLQIDFDPSRTSYARLLEVFWASHDPSRPCFSQQYKNAIFFDGPEQERLALESRERIEKKLGKKVGTELVPLTTFHRAEDYHQKWELRHAKEIERELRALYPDPAAFTDSTVACRVNGYLGGYGTRAALEKEIDSFGLSPSSRQLLLDSVPAEKAEK